MKIAVVGAGNVGTTCTDIIAQRDIVKEIVLLDIKKNLAEGKALDIWQSAPISNYNTRVLGVTNDYMRTTNSQVVVITSGLPRKPGMSRDDLIGTNARIIQSVVSQIIDHSPRAKIIIVSNPLDVMTYAAYRTVIEKGKSPEWASKNVLGMAGVLDTARYRAFLADELGCVPQDIQALLLGGHGDTMVPLPRYTSVSGIPVTELIKEERLTSIIERTKKGGGEIINLLGTSAWYAPGASAAQMVEAIVKDYKRILPCCVLLQGEYDLKEVYLGVPVVLGAQGVEDIIELNLDKGEKELLNTSALHVKEGMNLLDEMKLFQS
ncbi:malate dehydrogenase [Bacteroidetes bacterium endosymbiont of Geopemphigus sp.]|uniref:malate dehydrogenase n=1 Tax=Bacteroidetes bacterium endosymbiont of Geopemphigus sp. TaxID=2047937 RepID=UPI000CD1A278|nr:malate dehydrogenase [Bacteroidetes bacterium endosymbiont of Geopemphigus sp.]